MTVVGADGAGPDVAGADVAGTAEGTLQKQN